MNYGDFVIADVFNLYAKKNGQIVIEEEDLTDCGVSIKTTTKDVKAGQYNKIICVLRGDKTVEVTTTTPKFNLPNLALNLGQEIITGIGEGISKLQKAKIDSTLALALKRTPKTPSDLVIKYKGVPLVLTTDYTYSNGTVTFTGAGTVVEGDNIVVSPFVFVTNDKAKKIKIDSTTFPDGVELWLTTYAVNKIDGVEGELQFKFNEALADGAIEFATKSERDAVTNKITFKIIADDNDELGEIIFIPKDELVTITPISDLSGNGGALKSNLTFSAPTGATSVTLKYKKSSVSTYSTLNTSTATGVYAVAPLDATSTSVEVLGLDASTTYNFKLVYIVNNTVYESNLDTEKTTA